jgi:hypothetical protein
MREGRVGIRGIVDPEGLRIWTLESPKPRWKGMAAVI